MQKLHGDGPGVVVISAGWLPICWRNLYSTISSDQTSLHFQATRKDKNWHNIDIEILWVLQKAEVALAKAAETIRAN